ncbi:hypothetical protein [Streptomyces sp. JJ38]|uniref:hypothetical protein n=1 Tax=Streptomyces sp. JJ38 TaxID=2738128 RepID=UPI001C5945BD|nr:hypothetical protein [Streptomyces sp. JJ38]MBW1597502.1 hypothetical protein [Streptomyces sp. JJ38]
MSDRSRPTRVPEALSNLRRSGPRDAFDVYRLLHQWQDFSHRLHEAGHQPYCLVWP